MSDSKTIDPTKLMSPDDFQQLLSNPPASLVETAYKVRSAMAALNQLQSRLSAKRKEVDELRDSCLRQEGAVTVLQQLLIEEHRRTVQG